MYMEIKTAQMNIQYADHKMTFTKLIFTLLSRKTLLLQKGFNWSWHRRFFCASFGQNLFEVKMYFYLTE